MLADSRIKNKLPPNLHLTALLSSGITIVVSICYIVLCTITLIYRYNCDAAAPDTTDNAQFTWHTIYRIYIQDEECDNAIPVEMITQSHTVFVLVTTTLCASVLTLITSIVLTVGVQNKDMHQYINIFVFAYVFSWVASLAVDVTFGVHLGMDYRYLTQELRDSTEYIFLLDALRHGTFILMAVTLKGYVTLALNIVLILLLIIFSCDYQDADNTEQHSIHKVGALNAYEQPRRGNNSWVQPELLSPYSSQYPRGQTNNSFIHDDDHLRSLPRSDNYPVSSQSFNRSDSWQHQPHSQASSRPFSYLEEIRRPVPLKPAPPPAAPSQDAWRREPWPAPVVPAPDYSPHAPRRLKSALKPAYM